MLAYTIKAKKENKMKTLTEKRIFVLEQQKIKLNNQLEKLRAKLLSNKLEIEYLEEQKYQEFKQSLKRNIN